MNGWPLEAGEPLLWEGRPSGAFSLTHFPLRRTAGSLAAVIGGIGVAMTLVMGAVEPALAVYFLAGSAALLAVALGLLGLANRSRRRGLDYAVTDRRALLRYRRAVGYGQALWPYDPDVVAVRAEGRMPSVLVGRGPVLWSGEAGGTMVTAQDYALEMIDEAETVADLLRAAAARNAPDRPAPVRGIAVAAAARNWRIEPR